MKKQFITIFTLLFTVTFLFSQVKGTKIGFINMDYILQKVPSYTEAQNELEQKAQKWKQDIEAKKNDITKLKDALKIEKPLLTKSLIEERATEIELLERGLLDYQQKRFGPNGDLMTQKNDLAKPIQDQVFTIIQDIAAAKKYDFIFDKTSDMTILFADKRFDLSDQIVRVLNKTEKTEQISKKLFKKQTEQETAENEVDDNPALADRKKILEEKKAARLLANTERVKNEEERRKVAADRKQQMINDRAAKKNGETAPTVVGSTTAKDSIAVDKKSNALLAKQAQDKERKDAMNLRNQSAADRKKELEDRRAKMLEEKAALKATANENSIPKTPSTAAQTENKVSKEDESKIAAQEARNKQAQNKAKILEDRRKAVEENKKILEQKRQLVIDAKRNDDSGTISATTDKNDAQSTNLTLAAESKSTVNTENSKQKQIDAKTKIIEDRRKELENIKKEQDLKRQQALDAKMSRKSSTNTNKPVADKKAETELNSGVKDTVAKKENSVQTAAEIEKQKQINARTKSIEERTKAIEDRKKELEKRRKKVLEEKEAAKKAIKKD
jgi:Skp family chaperone for outer membrane proteins